jgi:hypothetical protein
LNEFRLLGLGNEGIPIAILGQPHGQRNGSVTQEIEHPQPHAVCLSMPGM